MEQDDDDVKMNVWLSDCELCRGRVLPPDTLKSKGKAVPLQAWSGPEGSKKLRLPDFMTTAQNGGKVASLTHRPPLPPGNTPGRARSEPGGTR